MPSKVHTTRGTPVQCKDLMLPAFGLPSGAWPPIPPHHYGGAAPSPASGAPSARLGGGHRFVIDHQDASFHESGIVLITYNLIPDRANVTLEGRAGRIEAFSVLLTYDP